MTTETTPVIERTTDGQVVRHACPRCEGLVAAERVKRGRYRTVDIDGVPMRERRVTLYCDHCDKTQGWFERIPA